MKGHHGHIQFCLPDNGPAHEYPKGAFRGPPAGSKLQIRSHLYHEHGDRKQISEHLPLTLQEQKQVF